MLYLVSRSLAQGTGAGMVSLAGCQTGSLAIMLCAPAGITAAPFAVPYAAAGVGRGRAGSVSLGGCQTGSLAIMVCAAAGITAALFAVPYAWDVLRLGGAAYLAWLAWQSVRPGGQPLFAPRPMPREGAVRLFSVGFATAALNPKVALFY